MRGDIFVFIQVGERRRTRGESIAVLSRPSEVEFPSNGISGKRQEPLTAGFKLEKRGWTLIAPLQAIKKEVWPARLKIEKERCEDKSIGDGQRKERQVPFLYLEAMYHCGIETRNPQLPPSSHPE